ncbi:amidohydrolase family protein [Mycolicibacterium hodleri]|uniref:amidohydrolase family protein n=1 Tax=Mycolicibacterium hodleri TaxID=49897 RepID=UPI00137589EC|nr:amidohydrolase family protein [Mycolicibacterium hodleri]
MALDYQIVDCDTHYYEPRDAFTRFIEPEFRDRAVQVTSRADGGEDIRVGDKIIEVVPDGFFHQAMRPGGLREMMRAVKNGSTLAESGVYEAMRPEWVSRPERLEKMIEQGVEASVLYPTLGVGVEHHLRHDVPALYANLHAFNRWIDEDWGYAYEGRIFGAPMLSLADPDRAVAELEYVLNRGARVIGMVPGHAHGHSPAHPMFDPFWARVEEAGVMVGLHIAESGYTEFYSTDFSEAANPVPHEKSALQWTMFYGDRPIMDTFAAMILHNLFGRFPKLRMMSVENGSVWVPYLLTVMDKMKGMGRSGPWLGGRVNGRPSEIFKEHIFVSPFHEESVPDLVDLIGARSICLGSDFPHPEGVAEPAEYVERLDGVDASDVRLMARDNLREILQLTGAAAVH